MDRWAEIDREEWVEERLGLYEDGGPVTDDQRRRAEEEYEDMMRDMDESGVAS